jgi:hypothetical protein
LNTGFNPLDLWLLPESGFKTSKRNGTWKNFYAYIQVIFITPGYALKDESLQGIA